MLGLDLRQETARERAIAREPKQAELARVDRERREVVRLAKEECARRLAEERARRLAEERLFLEARRREVEAARLSDALVAEEAAKAWRARPRLPISMDPPRPLPTPSPAMTGYCKLCRSSECPGDCG
jgi:hypothetical protein